MRFLLFLMLLACHANAQRPLDARHIAQVAHPRILLLPEEESALKKMIENEGRFRKVHETIIKECGRIISEPALTYKKEGRRLLTVARESRRRIFFLSYAWRLTADNRFLEKAEAELLAAAAFPDWNPSHFLDVAELTMALAIGYDWIFSGLQPSSKEAVASAIIRLGLEESLKPENNAWLQASNNWNQVCNAGMVYGALAVAELRPDLADEIIRRSIHSIGIAMQEYEPDGGYPEGYAYWAYGTTFNVLMISAFEKLNGARDLPISLNPGFLNTGYYLLHMAGQAGLNFNYSDNDSKESLNPAMAWFANRNGDPALLYQELKVLDKVKNLHRLRELPAMMIWGIGLDLSKVSVPSERMWVGKGKNQVATIRSDWDDAEGIFIGFKAGSPAHSHGHMDVGSFVLDALGERWAMDLGPQSYHSLEKQGLKIWRTKQDSDRWKVFRHSNFSHNTLTIDNCLQKADGEASIKLGSTKESFLSCKADLTPVYSTHAHSVSRGVALMDKKHFLVEDNVILKKDGLVKWQMLTAADIDILDSKTAELRLNGKKMFLKIVHPENAILSSWPAIPPADFDAPNPDVRFLGFEVGIAAQTKTKIFVVISPDPLVKTVAILPGEEWPFIE